MKIHDYELVEETLEMNVNVFCYENKIYPIHISKKSYTQVLNVLLTTNEEKSHYAFIKVPIPFKIYADTEYFLKRTNSYEGEYTIKYQEHFLNSIGAKLVCIDDRFILPTINFKGEKCVNKFIKLGY